MNKTKGAQGNHVLFIPTPFWFPCNSPHSSPQKTKNMHCMFKKKTLYQLIFALCLKESGAISRTGSLTLQPRLGFLRKAVAFLSMEKPFLWAGESCQTLKWKHSLWFQSVIPFSILPTCSNLTTPNFKARVTKLLRHVDLAPVDGNLILVEGILFIKETSGWFAWPIVIAFASHICGAGVPSWET